MKKPIDKESVLYAFAVEANHDRGTLERYLRGYPELAEELIDLSSELRMGERLAGPRGIAISDPGFEEAWQEFPRAAPQQASGPAAVADPFAGLKGAAFAAVAKAMDVPRSILTAIRDGLVVPASMPKSFFAPVRRRDRHRSRYRERVPRQTRQAPAGIAFKSDKKPSPQGQVTFRQLVQSTEMTESQRIVLLGECDEDGLD